jgi:hypothetical protein
VERVETDVDGFLASLPDGVRETMTELDAIVRSCLPGRSRTLWEGRFWGGTDQRIVGYGQIEQPRPRGEPVEWFLVGLARQRTSYSLYVNAVEDGAYLPRRFADRLGKVKVGSASVGFDDLGTVDVEVLRQMLGRAHELSPPDVG